MQLFEKESKLNLNRRSFEQREKREGEGNSTRQPITFQGIAFCRELRALGGASTGVRLRQEVRRGSSERRKDLGRKLIRVITVASHLGHRSLGLVARGTGYPARDTGVALKCTGTAKHRASFPGVVLRRRTSDVSPFEHAPALTSESAFN